MTIRRVLPIAALAALSACTHEPRPGAILTRTEVLTRVVPLSNGLPAPPVAAAVAAPAPARCNPRIGPAPAYPDRDEALREAPSIYEQVQMLLAARRMRMERERELAEALRSCTAGGR
jgi:hypothetical protein